MYRHENICNDPGLSDAEKRRMGCPVRKHSFSESRGGKKPHHKRPIIPVNPYQPKPTIPAYDLPPGFPVGRKSGIPIFPLSRRMLPDEMGSLFEEEGLPMEMEMQDAATMGAAEDSIVSDIIRQRRMLSAAGEYGNPIQAGQLQMQDLPEGALEMEPTEFPSNFFTGGKSIIEDNRLPKFNPEVKAEGSLTEYLDNIFGKRLPSAGADIEPFGQSSSFTPRPEYDSLKNESEIRSRLVRGRIGERPAIEPTEPAPIDPYDFGPLPKPADASLGGDIELTDLTTDESGAVASRVLGQVIGRTYNTSGAGTMEDIPLEDLDEIPATVEGGGADVDVAGLLDSGFFSAEGAEVTGGVAAGIGESLSAGLGVAADVLGPVGFLVGMGLMIKDLAKGKGHDTSKPGLHRLEGHMVEHMGSEGSRYAMYKSLKKQNKDGKYDELLEKFHEKGNIYVATSETFHKLSDKERAAMEKEAEANKTVEKCGRGTGCTMDYNDKGKKLNDILNAGGFYPTTIVHEGDAISLAKWKATLQLDHDAFKGVDPNLLRGMGLNPDLSKGWDGKSNVFRDGFDTTNITDDMVNQATGIAQQDITAAQAVAQWKQNKTQLDKYKKGSVEYNYLKSLMDHLAWAKNLDPATGKSKGVGDYKTDEWKKSEPKILPAPTESFDDIVNKVKAGTELSNAEQKYLSNLGYDPHNSRTSIEQFQASLQYKHDLDMINKVTDPTKKKYYLQQLKQYAWKNGLGADGTPLDKGQKQAGDEPADIPEDIQKQYDADKAKYDQNNIEYHKYDEIRDLMGRRQELFHQADTLLDQGHDYSDVMAQINALNQQISNKYGNLK